MDAARVRKALNRRFGGRDKQTQTAIPGGIFMRRSILTGLAAALAGLVTLLPAHAQQRSQLGPLCTSENTPADKQIDACNKIIALKVFSGDKLADVYFWRAVGWNKKGDYTKGDCGYDRGDPP